MDKIRAEKVTETLTVYQKHGVFCYGTDAVMLANFVKNDILKFNGKKMCDLCSGTGIVPLLLCDYSNEVFTTGLEINTDACEISRKSADISGYSNRFNIINGDVKDYKKHFSTEQFDFVTCNPPYMKSDSGAMCEYDYKTIARHEILCTLDDIFKAANYLLRTGGDFYVVYRTDRLSSLFGAALNNDFQIKKMILGINTLPSQNAKLCVIKAKKGAAEGLKLSVDTINNLCGKNVDPEEI